VRSYQRFNNVIEKVSTMSQGGPPKEIHDYCIMSELGHGSFARVFKAFNRQNRRNYAVKVFPISNLAREAAGIDRFQREIDSMAHMRHPNLVALHDFFWDESNFYLVIDLCPGGELFNYIIKHDRLNEPLGAVIFKQICEAIAYCHSLGVAHRDLKPENILIDRFPIVKVADFGLCGFVEEDRMMSTFCRSPLYCAPECGAKQEYSGLMSDYLEPWGSPLRRCHGRSAVEAFECQPADGRDPDRPIHAPRLSLSRGWRPDREDAARSSHKEIDHRAGPRAPLVRLREGQQDDAADEVSLAAVAAAVIAGNLDGRDRIRIPHELDHVKPRNTFTFRGNSLRG
jgi:serine/threonine protein kinase